MTKLHVFAFLPLIKDRSNIIDAAATSLAVNTRVLLARSTAHGTLRLRHSSRNKVRAPSRSTLRSSLRCAKRVRLLFRFLLLRLNPAAPLPVIAETRTSLFGVALLYVASSNVA